MMYRHGDILVAQITEMPEQSRPLRHLTLAEGELTGHSHRIAEAGAAELFQATDSVPGELYLRVTAEFATLIHQEHGPIQLPQGDYRTWRQREYSPREIRTVRD